MVLYSSAFLFNRNIHCPKLIYFQFITKANLEPGTEHLLKLSDQFLVVGAAICKSGWLRNTRKQSQHCSQIYLNVVVCVGKALAEAGDLRGVG